MPSFSTPILFIIFNRPETTQVVFDAIKKVKPKYLYVAADGPRETNEKDKVSCAESRKIIEQIDWECEVKTLFQDKNLGCKYAVSGAIDWFFANVEEGIILEDDCVPHPDFFAFCNMMLEHHRRDENVMMIAGTNYFFGKEIYPESYGFSRFYAIWGWATWRRAWQHYDVEMKTYSPPATKAVLKKIYRKRKIVRYYSYLFDLVHQNKLDTWDVEWAYTCIINNGLSIVPGYNLITNIGEAGSHTKTPGPFHAMLTHTLDLAHMTYPTRIEINPYVEKVIYNRIVKSYIVTKFMSLMRRMRQR